METPSPQSAFSPMRSLLLGFVILAMCMFVGGGLTQALAWMLAGERGNAVMSGVGLLNAREVWTFRFLAGFGNAFQWGVAALAWAALNGKAWQTLQMNRRPPVLPLLACAVAMALALPAMQNLMLTPESFRLGGMQGVEQWAESQEKGRVEAIMTLIGTPDVGAFLVNLVVIALVPALAEEMFFRGALQGTLMRMMNGHVAVWVAAVLFSALHFQFLGFLPRLLMGALLGYACWRSGSLWVSVAAHFCFNAANLLAGFLAMRGLLPQAVMDPAFRFPWWGVVVTAVVSAALLWLGLRRRVTA